MTHLTTQIMQESWSRSDKNKLTDIVVYLLCLSDARRCYVHLSPLSNHMSSRRRAPVIGQTTILTTPFKASVRVRTRVSLVQPRASAPTTRSLQPSDSSWRLDYKPMIARFGSSSASAPSFVIDNIKRAYLLCSLYFSWRICAICGPH